MKKDRNSIRSRLRHWGRWTQAPRLDLARSSSIFGIIVDMHENAGIRGDGIIYEIIDGVSIPPDGGMSAAIEQRGHEAAHDIRCRETHEAVSHLSERLRQAVTHTFVVQERESTRTAARVAELMDISVHTAREYLAEAFDQLSDRIYGRFVLVEEGDELAKAA